MKWSCGSIYDSLLHRAYDHHSNILRNGQKVILCYCATCFSPGKFEDSYCELLPLIPRVPVLTRLCWVVISTEDSILRNTAIEFMSHNPSSIVVIIATCESMLRNIIPALDSNSNELIDLVYVPASFAFWVSIRRSVQIRCRLQRLRVQWRGCFR